MKINDDLRIIGINVYNYLIDMQLSDGRSLSVPISWYPRLVAGTEKEINNIKLIGNGIGVHWPDLDEDLSLQGFLDGKKSGERMESFFKWLDFREDKETPKLFNASYIKDYKLHLEFLDGFCKFADFSKYKNQFKSLKDFKKFKIDLDGILCWKNDVDICPDLLYYYMN